MIGLIIVIIGIMMTNKWVSLVGVLASTFAFIVKEIEEVEEDE